MIQSVNWNFFDARTTVGRHVRLQEGGLHTAADRPRLHPAWPVLPVVVTESRIRQSQRAVYRALEACRNLRIELSGYWLHHGVEYITFGRTGRRPQDMTFHDCHGHLGGLAAHYHIPDGDLDSVVGEMERLGVEQSCVFSFAGVTSDECVGNDIVADAVKRYPDRFIGFTLLNPHRGREAMRKCTFDREVL